MSLFIRDSGFRDTLQDLRANMVQRFAWLSLIACLLALYLLLFNATFQSALFALLAGMALGIWLILRILPSHTDAARYSFLLILHAGLLLAMAITRHAWLPYLGIGLVLMAGMTVSYGHWASAALVYLGALVFLPETYPMTWLLALLSLTLAILQTSVASLYTALAWYRAMQERADALLSETRERRAELVQTLKSLDSAYQNLHRTQQQLIHARQQADEARRMKERFAANISHELRTPLNLIVGFSELMVMTPEVYSDEKLPPKLTRDMYQIYTSSRHLLELIDDVLDLSQVELSSFSLNFESTHIAQFIEDANELLRDIFRSGRLRFSVWLAPDLPEVEIDRTRIRQVLLNLLSNAERFTERGSVQLRVWQEGQEVFFAVRDTGRGVPADKQVQIFQEFYQIDSSLSRQHGGAGLGLAISKRFVETHGGRIWVTSPNEDGVGATFSFSVPVRTFSTTGARSAGTDDLRPKQRSSLLLLDHDPNLGALLGRVLDPHQVLLADSPAHIEALVQEHHPQLIIQNLAPHAEREAPDARLSALNLPIIRCSLPSATWALEQWRADGYLMKPISPEQLASVLIRDSRIERVLMVDDDWSFVQLVQRTFESLPTRYALHCAFDAQQALASLQTYAPQLVLLDWSLADAGAETLISALRANPATAQARILLLTSSRYLNNDADYASPLSILPPAHSPHRFTFACLRALVAVLDENLLHTPLVTESVP
jgi:signal transduction histidine kinase/CheY-like chemotaxis protein